MAGWGDAAGAILGWFSPEQRMKAKRIKKKQLEDRIRVLENGSCTLETAKKVDSLKAKLAKIALDLEN